jgi:PhnB protein
MEVVTYLNFDGNCRQAMEFYRTCLRAELYFMPFSEAPADLVKGAEPASDRVMHASLTKGARLLMASDTMPGQPFQQGTNFSVCLQCGSHEEIEALFTALGENGKVTMPLQDTFWGARFGMLTDQFGIQWMFNFERPKQV